MAAPRKRYNVNSKDATTHSDKNAQFCNRIGCSGRIKYSTQNTKIESSDKAKCSKPSCSSNMNEMIGKSSRSSSSVSRAKSSSLDSKTKLSSQSKFDRSESSQSGDSEAPKLTPSAIRAPTRHHSRSTNTIGSSSVPSNTRSRKMFQQKSESKNKSTPPASYVPSVSNSSCSSSKSESSTKNVMKKTNPKGENNLPRKGKQTTASSSSSSVNDKNDAAFIRTRRSMDANSSTTRLSHQQNGTNTSANGCSSNSSSYDQSIMMPCPSTPVNLNDNSARLEELNRSINEADLAFIAFHRLSMNEELTPEEIVALETSTFLDNPNMYDQHRGMRMDIDNMPYEELLALEETIGTVSTAVPEEALLECVERSIYQTTPSEVEDGADIICSICQEEYVAEDETGKLIECQHSFHLACINEWLRMKNWCPICKAAVASSQ